MIEVEFTLNGYEYSHVLPYQYTWKELEAKGFRFEDGWRVPARHELIDLFDLESGSRDSFLVWSASACANNSSNAWFIYFYNGYCSNSHISLTHSVRLIRELKSGD